MTKIITHLIGKWFAPATGGYSGSGNREGALPPSVHFVTRGVVSDLTVDELSEDDDD